MTVRTYTNATVTLIPACQTCEDTGRFLMASICADGDSLLYASGLAYCPCRAGRRARRMDAVRRVLESL